MKIFHTLFLCIAIIESCTNITASSNKIASTVQKDAQQNSNAERIQNYVEQYRRTFDFPDLSEEDSKKFVNALENADMNDAVAHLNLILNRKQISSKDTSTSKQSANVAVDDFPEPQFLKELDNNIEYCERGMPRLKKSLLKDQQELSSFSEYQPYLNHLKRYYNDLNNFNEKNKGLKDEYPMHSDTRKEAIRIQFYQEKNKLGQDYAKLHEFGK